jgi:hypothetical protein
MMDTTGKELRHGIKLHDQLSHARFCLRQWAFCELPRMACSPGTVLAWLFETRRAARSFTPRLVNNARNRYRATLLPNALLNNRVTIADHIREERILIYAGTGCPRNHSSAITRKSNLFQQSVEFDIMVLNIGEHVMVCEMHGRGFTFNHFKGPHRVCTGQNFVALSTHGQVNFYKYKEGSWCVFFAHPAGNLKALLCHPCYVLRISETVCFKVE